MIEAENLTKRYGDKTAVDDLSFTVVPGRVTGFLGPNGAGKSTTMRLLLGLDRPDRGDARIHGRHYRDLNAPLRVVGALLEARAIHTGRSAYNHLLCLAQTQGIGKRRVDEVVDLVGLTAAARKRAGGFSLGMGQRLGIAAALLGDPSVLILDEPVNGLDPEGIMWIRTLMQRLAAEGRTVFVSSHLMNEMAVTAEHLIVIGRGRLIADCSTEEFIERSTEKMVTVRSPDAPRLADIVAAEGGRVTSRDGALITVAQMEAPRVGELAAAEGIVLHELTPSRGSLESAFMELTRDSVEYGAGAGPGPVPGAVPGALPGTVPGQEGEPPMTTATAQPAADPAEQRRPGFGRLMLAEWTKIRTVRSTAWSLVLLVLLDLGFTALLVGLTMSQWDNTSAADRAQVSADPVSFILGSGFFLSQLTICVLGVLVIASEYSTGMIRASLLAVPRRLPMLWAKAAVFALVVLVLGIAVSFGSFFIGTALIGDKMEVSLGDEGVLRAVIGGGLYLAMLGLFALAIGAIVRHSAGGITGVIGFVLVLAPLAMLLPGSIGDHIHAYLPSEAGTLIAKAHQGPDDLLTPWQGYGVFALWTVALLALAAFLLKRRDA